ncbi:hypothetical protein ACLMAL_22590 [Nocardia sp. CWNU-33]|uniref:hypothetical protein n=1 Tax=Nocardia sp. CWNU-33 TaxID=3392117 RepID=UPI00398F4853
MKVAALLKHSVNTAEEAGQQLVDTYKIIGSPADNYPLDDKWLEEIGALSFQRAHDPAGKLRQQAAMLAAPDRRKALAALRLPTLVIAWHCRSDDSTGRRTSDRQGRPWGETRHDARRVGHGAFPREVWPIMIDNICAIAE